VKRLSLFNPNLSNMNVHSATCSWSIELYKQWYTLADFLPNWNFRGVFYVNHYLRRKDQRSCDGRGALYFFRVPCSSYRVRHSSVGCSVAQKVAAKLRRA
jgi:hypothetical protein